MLPFTDEESEANTRTRTDSRSSGFAQHGLGSLSTKSTWVGKINLGRLFGAGNMYQRPEGQWDPQMSFICWHSC